MLFEDIVGQDIVIRSLKNSIVNKRVAHAYLFCGPDGVGKSIIADILASTLNCREKKANPCGRCPSCIRERDGNHPDIIHLKPLKHAKSDKLSILVDDIRDLQVDMQKKPYESGNKVYIIDEADKMTEQAQNALLKILEEPPDYAVIILITFNQYSLLSTIISRCQVMKFTRASEKAIENYLVDSMSVPQKDARYIAALSDGIVGSAIRLINDEELKNSRNDIIELSESLFDGDKINVLSNVDYFIKNKDKINYIFGIMISWFRDIMIYKKCRDQKYLINLDKIDIIDKGYERYTYNNLYNIISGIKRTEENIKSNINFQLSIETMLLGIQEGFYGYSRRH